MKPDRDLDVLSLRGQLLSDDVRLSRPVVHVRAVWTEPVCSGVQGGPV